MVVLFPTTVRKALRKLGADIRDARLRRRISTSVMAQRMQISRATLHKIERGGEAVAIGSYATALFVLGLGDRLADIADARNDLQGLMLDEEQLPKRIRSKRVV